MTMYKVLHQIDDRLNVNRKEGRKGLVSIECCMNSAIKEFKQYTGYSKQRQQPKNCTKINRNPGNTMIRT